MITLRLKMTNKSILSNAEALERYLTTFAKDIGLTLDIRAVRIVNREIVADGITDYVLIKFRLQVCMYVCMSMYLYVCTCMYAYVCVCVCRLSVPELGMMLWTAIAAVAVCCMLLWTLMPVDPLDIAVLTMSWLQI